MDVCWCLPFCTGLELNGTGCTDKGETPPPLPLKGSTGDYGNLQDNQDLTGPSTPPPPPPHQRVGVLIRAECNFCNDACHLDWNKCPIFTLDIYFNLHRDSFTLHPSICLFLSVYPQVFTTYVFFSPRFSAIHFTKECKHQSVSSLSALPLFMLVLPEGLALRCDWLDDYFTSHVHQKLSSC